ncbi:uncharacterized protein LOC128984406 [Macrosteles quadrilineatus]|uniref:uncharacterized protein LOC128984406 n=1 Tax=Macrosteles quadrilineatus TaxID=74068 RepID=UPI0023E23E7C|nr:uncharacterized protein LOC128984406 [Macrosteles quadrilineatus]
MKVDTIDESPTFFNCHQPIFLNLLPKTSENVLIDNICITYFPLPDEPNANTLYVSRVFCDGSNDVTTYVQGPVSKGVNRKANPFQIVQDHIVAYAGCDTNVVYRCSAFGEPFDPYVFGASSNCAPLGLSCLRKIEEIIKDKNLPDQDFYVLPMKLPNRCVTQQLCSLPPNPFYNKLGPYGGAYLA